MKTIFKKHGALWSQKSFWGAVVIGLLLLVLSMGANYWANTYTAEHASNSVTDIILDNVPTVNVNFIFSEGAIVFLAALMLIILYEPKRIPFSLKATALFVLIRSIFITLTHLAPPLNGSYLDTSDLIYKISSGDDLFFSAHTGLPFMFAVIFWDNKYLKYFFLVCTIIGGSAVLLGHLHYSIDVFSALFISFGIFYIAKEFFLKDYRLLVSE